MRLRAVARRFSVATSAGRSKISPQAARTAGATWTTTTFSGSLRAPPRPKMALVSSRDRRALTGQWVMHWPHRAQSALRMSRPPETPTVVWEPVPTMSQTLRDWTLSQKEMQRMHLTHLLSLRIRGKLSSQLSAGYSWRKFMVSSMLMELAIFLSWQDLSRLQAGQLMRCWLRISSILVRRASRTLAELVRIFMPSVQTLLQAVIR